VARSVGRLAGILGLPEFAEQQLARAEQVSRVMMAPVYLAHTHLDWGRINTKSDQPSHTAAARAHLTIALDLAVLHKFAFIERKARQALEEIP
jgi:hypothetical protein